MLAWRGFFISALRESGKTLAIIRAPEFQRRADNVTANILDGKAVAAKQRQATAIRAREFQTKFGRQPGLAVVKVGDDPASAVYVRNKRKACEECDIASFAHDLPATTSREELLSLIQTLNRDDAVDGCGGSGDAREGGVVEAGGCALPKLAKGSEVDGFGIERQCHARCL